MQATRADTGPCGRAVLADLDCAASPIGVRDAVRVLRRRLALAGVATGIITDVEIAVTEALNNIVEHALHGADTAPIRLRASSSGARLRVVLRDRGAPMPQLAAPRSGPAPTELPRIELPEGGFGRLLICELAERVRYDRRGQENVLTLDFRNCPSP